MSMDTTPPPERAAADPQPVSDLVVVGDNQTLWQRIQAGIDEARRRTLGVFLDALAQRKARRDEAAFSIALIALSAKMAKADGVVTDDEVAA
ncbi:MAG: hypothetical protein AAF199_07045, partial [Pseudomonadota bacterium]